MRVTVLLVALLSACSPASTDLSPDAVAAIEADVRSALATYQGHLAEGRWQDAGAMYSDAPGFRIYEDGVLRYPSADAVRESLAGMPPGTRLVTDFESVEVRVLGERTATVDALYQTRMIQDGVERYAWGGATTTLWVREDGGWRIVGGHSSSPGPSDVRDG